MDLFDFFRGLDMYTDADREKIIENNKISNEIALEVKEIIANR